METFPTPTDNHRYGFHYYPDAEHYRESDLRAWLPELRSLGASWLTLVTTPERAIPEFFLRGIINAGIEPILHFPLSLSAPPQPDSMKLLFETYARWGVHYISLFNRPNRRCAWSAKDWAQNELVERFIDIYLPLAEATLSADLIPVFPPLEPGGDYWDTAFLRSALHSIQRRGRDYLARRLVIGAYAWADNRSLNWGAGGPERWPGARPYFTPIAEEDQRGFRIFDWYLTIARAALGHTPAILLVGMGCHIGDQGDPDQPPLDSAAHAERNLTLARLLAEGDTTGSSEPVFGLDSVPVEVIGGNFWLLTAPAGTSPADQAWIKPNGESLPVVGALRQWASENLPRSERGGPANPEEVTTERHPIANYLLLPTYEWGIADWHLEVIRPYVKRHRPVVGFSVDEAIYARHVTVIGGTQSFPEDVLDTLRSAGCKVERIQGDGTSIASQLATL